METTQEEREQYQDAIGTAYDEDGDPRNEFLLRLIHDADRLAAIERDVRELAESYEGGSPGQEIRMEIVAEELRDILGPPK